MTFVINPLSGEQQLALLRACPLFQGVPDDGLGAGLENSGYVRFRAGDVLNREGDVFKCCPLIISGSIEVFRLSWLGEEKIFGQFGAGEVVAIAAAFMPHNRYPMSLRAREDGEALLLDKRDILGICHRYPQIMARLLANLSLKLYDNINQIDWLTSSSAEQRLAAFLLELGDGVDGNKVVLPCTRSQLAARLGIRYETLSRLISGWKKKSLISSEKDIIEIKDDAYLRQLAFPARRPF